MTAHAAIRRMSVGLGILLVVISLAVGACGTAPADGPTAEGPPPRTASAAPDGSAGTTTPAREVFFPTLIPHSTDLPDALGGGKLIVDGRGCLRLRSVENSATPLWPPGFELRAGEGGIRVLDGRGRLRAKVGERVVLGGGYTTRGRLEEGGAPLEAKTERELFERCPGWYFITGGVVDRPSGRQGDT